ncbi:phosphoheptose isomerase [Alphaproteobacteria bacterium]|nr:phosphoheptose isomerase [Alphaproteobacteria bacterium]
MKTLCFDLDGTLCSNTWGKYEEALPNHKAINKVNELHKKGYKIIIYTSRYMGRCNSDVNAVYKIGYKFTKYQLDKWFVNYDKLILGKPSYDVIVDDKSFKYDENWIDELE